MSSTNDLVVVLPGIMGSTLARAGRIVWAPSAGAVLRAITSFGRSIKSLSLPKGIGDQHPSDDVVPVGLMPDLHVLPWLWTAHIGYDKLLDWLRAKSRLIGTPHAGGNHANVLPIPYDWRLSNRFNGRQIKPIVESALERWRAQGPEFRDAQLVFVCHSMGGLVARWYIDKEGGAEVTRKLITLGTPHRGALKALEQLVNAPAVGIGPLGLDLADFSRSLPSMHQLLPEYACLETSAGLVKTTETVVPELASDMVDDAMLFYEQLNTARSKDYDLHPIVGFRQRTPTTARVADGRILALDTIEGSDEGGDATVPRLSATPAGLSPNDPSVRAAADRHGSLQSNQAVLDELEFVLGARTAPYRSARIDLSVEIAEWVMAGDAIDITATPADESRSKLRAQVRDESGGMVSELILDAGVPKKIENLGPGGYQIIVGGVGAAATRISETTCPLLVWAPSEDA